MALQFTNSIVSRISTVNLERQLLHALMLDKINLQRSIGKHHSDFFTNRSRIFIYDCIVSTFNDRRCVLTKDQFEFELQKRYDLQKDKQVVEDYTSEFDIIKKTTLTESVENIIERLNEVQLGNNTETLIREAYAKLESGEFVEAADLVRIKSVDLRGAQADGRVISLHKDSDDWFEAVRNRKEHPEMYAGIPTGFEKFDKITGGLFPAELTIVFGLSGKGKSTFMKAVSCNIRKQNRVVLHCGNEENEFQMRSKYMSADSGEKYSPFKKGTYTDDEYNRLKIYSDKARGVGDIYIYEFPQQTDVTYIERAYRFLELKNIHVDVIVIDYLDLMKPVEKAYSENDEQGKITSDLKQLAINCHCPVLTATQAGTQSEKQEKKAKPFLTQADVFGTKRKVHSANCLIGIVNQTATAQANDLPIEQRTKHKIVLCVPKNRDGAVFTFRQILDVECGKFYEDTDEDDPTMNNLEKQSMQMIDESLPPDKMRDEIDVKEMQMAKKEHLDKQLKELEESLKNSSSSQEDVSSEADEFLSDAPKDVEVKEEEVTPAPVDDFLGDAPAEEPVLNEEKKETAEVDPFLGDASSSDSIMNVGEENKLVVPLEYESNEEKNEIQVAEPCDGPDEEPLTPFDEGNEEQAGERLEGTTSSDEIPHKKSLAEIMKGYKKRA